MLRNSLYKIFPALTLAAALVTGCKKWDDHNAVTEPALNQTLFEQISADTSLSQFADLLIKTGYDQVIASSKTFTVFAPTNAALAGLDAATINDTAKLRKFVGNHIANQSIFTSTAATSLRIPMLNGKYQNMQSGIIADATITGPDHAAKNGVFHVINKMLPALGNIWETLDNNPFIPAKQRAFLLSLFAKVRDTTNAVQIGVDPNTGEPVYQPGTDSITTNIFWRNVYDLRDERKQYTLFVLNDVAWDAETIKYSPYFKYIDSLTTTTLAKFQVVKDFAFDTLYAPASIPDTILSKFNVKVPVHKPSIVRTITTSNGIIYVMNKAEVQPKHKLLPIIIQGENYRATSADRRGNTYFRDRYNDTTKTDFRDVLVFGHGVSQFNINYRVLNVYSVKYKAYWVAFNDFQTANFQQKLAIGTPTDTRLNYVTVTPRIFTEKEIGTFEIPEFLNFLDLYLVAANSTTAAVNPLVCDYIKLVPDL
jgi:uncharacterized surface protein with fasciclin (FAS1) repeats